MQVLPAPFLLKLDMSRRWSNGKTPCANGETEVRTLCGGLFSEKIVMQQENQTESTAISQAEMDACLEVLQRVSEDPTVVDDHERFKGLVAKIHRLGKRGQRDRKRKALQAATRTAVESTGIVRQQNGTDRQRIASADNPVATKLLKARPCYVCKSPYSELHHFYHLLCPECASFNWNKRTQRSDLCGGNNLGAADAVSIAKSLAKSGTIESLMLGVNFLGDAGAISIADLLPHCPALRELGLASNGIATSGTAALCSAIRRHPKLVYFDLGFAPSTKVLGAVGNVPGNDGFQSILKLVSANSSLRRLNLRGICITDHDKEQLGVAMQSNTHLVSLIVEGRLPQAISDRLIQNLDQSPQCNDAPEEVRLIRSVYRTATKRACTVGFNTKES